MYQVDQEKIVKIGTRKLIELKSLQDFLSKLTTRHLPFETPCILDSGEIDGQSYTIEKLVSGSSLREVFPCLSAGQQERCIRELFDVLDVLSSIELPGSFGELLLGEPGLTDPSWRGFLYRKCVQVLQERKEVLRVDFPDIDKVADLFAAEVLSLPAKGKPLVVHGDLYFPNIMASAKGRITGIIDFSEHTLAGDPMVDRVSLAVFARENEGQRLINQLIEARFKEEFLHLKRLYGVYYAFRFSGCKSDDPDTYKWCLETFARYISSY